MPRHDRYDNTGMFRHLNPTEEIEFMTWAHEHPDQAKYRLDTNTLCLVHPIVRAEWRRMGLIPEEA